MDVFEARPDHLPVRRLAQSGDEFPEGGRALLVQHAVLAPTHDRDAGIRAANFVDATDLDEFAPRDDASSVAQLGRLVELVGRQQDGGVLRFEGSDQAPELTAGFRIETSRRLVEKEQLGPTDDAEGNTHPSALTAQQLAGAGLMLLFEPNAAITSSTQRALG